MTNDGRKVRTRSDRVLSRPVGNELVVYDAATDQAHLLNPLASRIWTVCVRGATLAELEALVDPDAGVDPALLVQAALEELSALGLLESHPPVTSPSRALSRRDLLRKAGIAAVLAPFVTTILAPTPAAAQITGPPCTPTG